MLEPPAAGLGALPAPSAKVSAHPTTATLSSIQALRACAVLAVVCHHAFRTMVLRLDGTSGDGSLLTRYPVLVEIGTIGVDVFFVLSGFLMILISGPYLARRRTIGNFLLHRLIRIWPLYALTTCFVLARTYIEYRWKGWTLPSMFEPQRLAGLAFVPSFDAGHMLRPILGVGWTLSYEMWFYACFAATIVFAVDRRRLILGLATVLTLPLGVSLLLPEGSVAQTFFGDTVVLEFLIGACLCMALQSRRGIPLQPWCWFAAATVWLALFAHIPADDGWRLGTRGIAAAFLFIGTLKLEGTTAFPKWLLAVGDASYSIYLTHGFLLYSLMLTANKRLAQVMPDGALALALPLLAAAVVVSIGRLVFHLVERPLLAGCRRLAHI